jgi:hypothetical protein
MRWHSLYENFIYVCVSDVKETRSRKERRAKLSQKGSDNIRSSSAVRI